MLISENQEENSISVLKYPFEHDRREFLLHSHPHKGIAPKLNKLSVSCTECCNQLSMPQK